MHRKLGSVVGWVIVGGMLVIAALLLGFVRLRQNQRAESLRLLAQPAVIEPTLPPFVIDRTSTVPLASSATQQSVASSAGSLLAQTILAPTPVVEGVTIEPLQTPTSVETLNVVADTSVPYVRGFDLILNQDGVEKIVAIGRVKTATQSAVTYAYPLISPNGTLLAFFEWIDPMLMGDLASAQQVVLKVLDITTGRIRTTPYRFPQLRHDLDGGLPIRWNARNFLEIEEQSTALNAKHILYDPDRNVVMAENNLRTIAHTPWKDRSAVAVLPGFTISPDGQWRVTTNEQQFLLHPVGSEKLLPITLTEIGEGQLVRFYGWFFGQAYFEIEKKEYSTCTQKALQLTSSQRTAALTACFLDTHYLVAVDPSSQQITRRWYNYQVGLHQDLRWMRLVWFLDQAVVNHKNEVIFLQPKVPLIYPSAQPLIVTTSPTGRTTVVITADKIEVWKSNDERNEVTLTTPLTMQKVLASSYRFVWGGNEEFVLLYPDDSKRTAEMSIIKVDLLTKQAEQIVNNGRSWYVP